MEETSSDEDSRLVAETRRRLREDPQGWLAEAQQVSSAQRIRAVVEAHMDASTEPYPVPPPPPDPLHPPATMCEEEDSVNSEYANEHEVPDDDMSTVAPSDASVLIYSISERVARHRAREAARRRGSDTIPAANEEAK